MSPTELKIPVKLFVSKFPSTFTEEQLRDTFEPFGEIESAVVLKSKDNARFQGCGFIRFTSVTDAARAIHELNGKHVIDSNIGPLNVEYASGEAERLNLPTTAEGTSVKLFVGGIPLDMIEEDVRDYFSKYGQVTECHLLPQKTSNPLIQTKAGFVRFARKADGLAAIDELDKKISFPGVERAMDVRLAEVRETKSEDKQGRPGYQQMPQRFPPAQRPVMPYQQVQPVPPPPMPLRAPRTIGAWTEYHAADGRPYYHNGVTGVTSWEAPVEFRMAGPPPPQGMPIYQPPPSAISMSGAPVAAGGQADAKGPLGSNLFVFHIPAEWSEGDLFSQFSTYGNLISYRIVREKETNRPKGFGFVSYDNPGSAQAAIRGLNGMVVSTGKRLKVSVKKGEESGPTTHHAQPY